MPPEHAVDVVIVSAYPRVYTPSRTSVMGALHKKRISVDALSLKKAVDLTQAFSSWMSREIPTGIPGIHFNRIKIARSHTDAYLSFYDKLTYAHPYSTRSVHFPQHRETLARNQFVAVFLGRLSDSR